jgi:uncharacterized protein YbbC (DUF1343 family)
LEVAYALEKLYPGKIAFEEDRFLIGSREVIKDLQSGADPRDIVQKMEESLLAFLKQRERYLIYK